ncbi:glycosyltransferase, MGT family [Thermomonospora echinospora]|uniref:Glycosyltransferase, MGT family n=1 Tax=Thermomonospora echinospora TaxID=1992 RepID=A0A1H5XMH4_9ACTN|nr:glycosyltransferase [Thermomonospora echinospora]SEG12951.1 glycosyltransferase, MGT family [Thermomonospora echinospora]
MIPGLQGGGSRGSRFLFAVPPLAGHVNPTVAVGAELARRGHEVAWVGHPPDVRPLLGNGARLYPAPGEEFTPLLEAARREGRALHGPAAFRFLWEGFIVPLGHVMMPGVEAAVEDFRPHVVIADQQVLAAPVVARRRGLPWATSATTSAELARPMAAFPRIERWAGDLIEDFQRAYGDPDPMDLRFSDYLVLVFSTPALVDEAEGCPDHYAFVGPALGRPSSGTFPWRWLDGERPAILVSLGTVSADPRERFFGVAAEAVAGLDVQAVFVAPPEAVPDPPPNVLVRRHVPQLALLPRLSAVVSHGGHNTVCETLAHGLPLVVAPIRDDQPVNAHQVARAGAGIVVPFFRVRPPRLREAITTVLTEDSYRHAACAVQASFRTAGGARAAADRLEKLT